MKRIPTSNNGLKLPEPIVEQAIRPCAYELYVQRGILMVMTRTIRYRLRSRGCSHWHPYNASCLGVALRCFLASQREGGS
jgi:hypothetical protein